jgi:hypothetical protein
MGIIRKLIKNRIVLHLVFCFVVASSMLYLSSLGFSISGIPVSTRGAGQYPGYFFILFCIYLGRWITKKYWHDIIPSGKFFLFSIFCWIGILAIWWSIIVLFYAPNAGFLEFSIGYGPFLTIAFTGGILIKLIRTSITNQIKNAELAAEQSKSELRILQSQLSPHFLFNTLNNIYGISLTQKEKIPSLLLKLSELLRYSVYEAKEMFVPLKDEIAYIKNYIQFEKIRLGDRLELNDAIEEISDSRIKIVPMLLIIFIENSFKHAKGTKTEKMIIDFRLKVDGDSIFFTSKNSYDKGKSEKNILTINSGFGLDSAARRLGLIYPDEHVLKIKNDESYYYVELKLKIR